MTSLRSFFWAFSLVAILFGSTQSAHAIVLHFEDFNDSTIGYTSTLPDPGTSDSNESYFGRIGGAGGLTVGGGVSFTNTSGGYFGASQTALNSGPNIGSGLISWTGINISGFTNLSFSGLFAEDDDPGVADRWDPNSEVLVSARIDGGSFFNVFGIQSSSNASSNTAPRVDTNFDGLGDGAEITDTFTQFVANIAGTGNLLDLRIVMSGLTEVGEDIAFDNIMITGDEGEPVATPEPGSLALLGSLAFGGFIVRRRRRRAGATA